MTQRSTGLLALGLTALFLAASSPAFAQSKKKAAAAEEKSGAAEKPDTEAAEPKEEEYVEPDAWERPPEEEEEAPKAEPKAPPPPPEGDGNNVEAGLLLGWGFQMDKGTFSTDPYQLGLGLRLGYAFEFKLFIGLGFEYFLGTSGKQTTGTLAAPVTRETAANYMFFHTEVGYDLWFGDVILRPSMWLGAGAGAQDPHPISNTKKTVVDFFFGPGASVIYVMDGTFIGGDLRMHKVTGDGGSAIVLYATGGLRF
jgi:hypothetical protein